MRLVIGRGMKRHFGIFVILGGFAVLFLLYRSSVLTEAGTGSGPPSREGPREGVGRLKVLRNSTLATDNTSQPMTVRGHIKKEVSEVAVQRERAVQLQKTCEQLRHQHSPAAVSSYRRGTRYIVDGEHHLVYCPIEKVGSSFWKRVFSLLKLHSKVNTRQQDSSIKVFNMSGVVIHRKGKLDKLEASRSLSPQSYELLRSSRTFLFVRDPYERLFSGYIDKLFTPTFETGAMAKNVLDTEYLSRLSPGRRLRRADSGPRSRGRDGFTGRLRAHAKGSDLKGIKAFGFLRNETDSRQRNTSDFNNVKWQSDIELSRRGRRGSFLEEFSYGHEENRAREVARGYLYHEEPDDNDSVGDGHREDGDDLKRDSPYGGTQKQRDSHTRFRDRFKRKESCQLHVPFAQFVRHVINGVAVNEHFKPMSSRCPPCFFRYDFVGKLETFKDDVNFILTSAGIDPADVIGDDSSFDHDSDMNILRDVTERTFSVMRKYEMCMTRAEMLHRTWVTFQIRGFLSTHQPFPLTRKASESVTPDEFIQLVHRAYARSGPREMRMRQRKVAMLEAFYGLPRSLLKDLESYVDTDCRLFGYGCSVESRFSLGSYEKPVFHFDRLFEDNSSTKD